MRRVDVLESKVDKKHEFVMNTETFCVHMVLIWGNDIPAPTWETTCRWKFGAQGQHAWKNTLSEKANSCDRCWGRNADKIKRVRKEFLEAQKKGGVEEEKVESDASSSDPEHGWSH